MPINATQEYFLAEKRYLQADTREEKIAALQDMIRELPKHKGTETLLGQLKKRLAKLREQEPKKGGRSYNIEKTGDAQICIIGKANSGKSTLLKKLSGKNLEISEKEYTTTKPEVGIFNYDGAKLQLIELPATFETKFLYLLDTCDLVVTLYKNEREKQEMKDFLSKRNVLKKALFTSLKDENALEKLKERIWEKLGLIRVYTKTKNKKENEPIVLKKGSTVKDLALEIHKDFYNDFNFARIFDNTKFSGRKVGLKYKLKEKDIVEINT